MERKILLYCGILSSLLYVAMNIIGALQWDEYSTSSQSISELFSIGAPSRPLWVVLGIVYQILIILFGYGVRRSNPANRPLRIAGGLLVVYGVIGFAAPFAPMHQRGAGGTLTDLMHINLTIVTVLLMFAAIGAGAFAFGKSFRIYSIVTIVLLLLFGALAAQDGPRLEKNLPTPGMGITERICVGVFLLWVIVLATRLLGAAVKRRREDSITTDASPPETDRAPERTSTSVSL